MCVNITVYRASLFHFYFSESNCFCFNASTSGLMRISVLASGKGPPVPIYFIDYKTAQHMQCQETGCGATSFIMVATVLMFLDPLNRWRDASAVCPNQPTQGFSQKPAWWLLTPYLTPFSIWGSSCHWYLSHPWRGGRCVGETQTLPHVPPILPPPFQVLPCISMTNHAIPLSEPFLRMEEALAVLMQATLCFFN